MLSLAAAFISVVAVMYTIVVVIHYTSNTGE